MLSLVFGAEILKKGAKFVEKAAAQAVKAGAKGVNQALFNFTKTTSEHMSNPSRRLPVSILKDAIQSTKGLPDPQGTRALMYYTNTALF